MLRVYNYNWYNKRTKDLHMKPTTWNESLLLEMVTV